MSRAKNTSSAIPSKLEQLAAQVGGRRRELGVLVFTLELGLPQLEVAQKLADQFALLQLNSRIASAGPEKVQAVLEGKFKGIDVLVVLGKAHEGTEDALMELVAWLLANGRQELAQNLVFAQLGHSLKQAAPAFNKVLLPHSYAAGARQSGLRLPWAASSHESWDLAEAVLGYAAGLGEE